MVDGGNAFNSIMGYLPTFQQLLNFIYGSLEAILGFTIIGAIGYAIYRSMVSYPVRVEIRQQIGTGGSYEIKEDKAKISWDDGGNRILQMSWLKDGKKPLSVPLPPAKFKCRKGGKDHYTFMRDDNNQLQPFLTEFESGSPVLRLWPQDMRAWNAVGKRTLREKYIKESPFSKHKEIILSVMAWTSMIVMIVLMFQYLNGIADHVSTSIAQLAVACRVT